MKHSPRLSDVAAQAYTNDMPLLSGYDPLQEIYHWSMISALLSGELLLVGIALVPMYNSLFFMANALLWGIRPGTLLPLFLLLLIIPRFFTWRRYRRERQQRELLQCKALSHPVSQQLPTRSEPSSQGLALPVQIESRPKSFFTLRAILGTSCFALLLLISYLTTFVSSWDIPFWLVVVPSVLGVGIVPSLYAGIGSAVRLRIAGHYLLPSLTIDDEAITARYGRDTISIAWRDVRYFGLVSSTTFHKLSGERGVQHPPEREAFEISDGENAICWLKAAPFRTHRLFRFGEVALSDQDYMIFTQQLALLIMEKTGLPLYDLRLTKQKSKRT